MIPCTTNEKNKGRGSSLTIYEQKLVNNGRIYWEFNTHTFRGGNIFAVRETGLNGKLLRRKRT